MQKKEKSYGNTEGIAMANKKVTGLIHPSYLREEKVNEGERYCCRKRGKNTQINTEK